MPELDQNARVRSAWKQFHELLPIVSDHSSLSKDMVMYIAVLCVVYCCMLTRQDCIEMTETRCVGFVLNDCLYYITLCSWLEMNALENGL